MDDDNLPLAAGSAQAHGLPRNLEGMSIDALQDYRVALQNEIARVEQALGHRAGARAGAEALFKS